jgi:thiamine-monophosphate kinase
VSTVGGLGEAELLKRIRPYLAAEGFDILAGEDDAAVWRDGDSFTVATCDTSVEGVHFDLAWMTPEDVGWRALALALGDLAAKGATPWWGLTSVAVSKVWPADAFVGLFKGIAELADKTGLKIVGGDTVATAGPAMLGLTVVGRTNSLPLARSQVAPGWVVAVTGALGAAALALRDRRPLRLEPLIAEGRRLNEAAICCGDISDGLVREMQKFSAASGVGCVIRATDVPIAEGASMEDALSSGEEAALVCVGPEAAVRGAGLQPIGTMTAEPAVRVVGSDGRPLAVTGYDHFA